MTHLFLCVVYLDHKYNNITYSFVIFIKVKNKMKQFDILHYSKTSLASFPLIFRQFPNLSKYSRLEYAKEMSVTMKICAVTKAKVAPKKKFAFAVPQ